MFNITVGRVDPLLYMMICHMFSVRCWMNTIPGSVRVAKGTNVHGKPSPCGSTRTLWSSTSRGMSYYLYHLFAELS